VLEAFVSLTIAGVELATNGNSIRIGGVDVELTRGGVELSVTAGVDDPVTGGGLRLIHSPLVLMVRLARVQLREIFLRL